MTGEIEILARATELVARELPGPRCVEAVGLMLEIGDRLGVPLTAQTVSLFAANGETGAAVATGDKGAAFGEVFLRGRGRTEVARFEGGSPFQRHAGHMIATLDDQHLLIDPSFGQFFRLGDQARPLFADDVRPRGNGAFWQVGSDSLIVRYFRAEEFNVSNFPEVRASVRTRSEEMVAELLLGR